MNPRAASVRRLRHREEARRAILDAAEELLLDGGYENFSMRRLAERCGYTTPTIYHYFQDKTGLIDALLEERLAKLFRRLRRVPRGDDPLANLRELALAFVRFGRRNPTHYRLLTTPRDANQPPPPSAEKVIELFSAPLRQLEDEGRLVARDLEAARQASWALMHGLILLTTSRPDYPWSKSLLDVAVEMMLLGLANGDGR